MVNPTPLRQRQTGFRLPLGEWFNDIIDRVNGLVAGTLNGTFTGTFGPASGVAVPRSFHTGEVAPMTTTSGNDTTPVVTEVYVARVFVPANTTITGLALLNGSAVAGNIQGALYNSAGVLVANTASTAQAGTAAYQQVALTTPYAAKGPASFYIAWSFNNTGARFRTHILGNFGAGKLTGQVYGTIPTPITVPATFTTNLGPVSDTY